MDGAGVGQAAVGRVGAQRKAVVPVHLIQKNRPGRQGGGQPLPVERDRRRVVTHMQTQVQAVIGRTRHAPRARGAEGAHIGWHPPVGQQAGGGKAVGRFAGACLFGG